MRGWERNHNLRRMRFPCDIKALVIGLRSMKTFIPKNLRTEISFKWRHFGRDGSCGAIKNLHVPAYDGLEAQGRHSGGFRLVFLGSVKM